MIQARNLKKVYSTEEVETTALNNVNIEIKEGEFVRALDGVDLTINQNEYISIMGPSGCGKSTLLNIMGLLDNPSDGEYHFLGHDVSNRTERERAQLRKGNIGFIFQSFNLIDELTVFENVELPLLYLGMSADERKEKAEAALERMRDRKSVV